MRRASPCMRHGFAYGAGHTLAPVLPLTGRTTFLRHPIACLLPDRIPRFPRAPRRTHTVRAVSITGLGRGAPSRVREYQTVVHRLRLSASPWVPPHPGGISLAQEPLVFRRRSFSLPSRYSCLHSPSRGVHGWIPPPLHPPRDAPLPIHTPGRPPEGKPAGEPVNATASAVWFGPPSFSGRDPSSRGRFCTPFRVGGFQATSRFLLPAPI